MSPSPRFPGRRRAFALDQYGEGRAAAQLRETALPARADRTDLHAQRGADVAVRRPLLFEQLRQQLLAARTQLAERRPQRRLPLHPLELLLDLGEAAFGVRLGFGLVLGLLPG